MNHSSPVQIDVQLLQIAHHRQRQDLLHLFERESSSRDLGEIESETGDGRGGEIFEVFAEFGDGERRVLTDVKMLQSFAESERVGKIEFAVVDSEMSEVREVEYDRRREKRENVPRVSFDVVPIVDAESSERLGR